MQDVRSPEGQRILRAFAGDLLDLKERYEAIHGPISFEEMGRRVAEERAAGTKNLAGSKNTFSKMTSNPARPPSAQILAGFVFALEGTTDDLKAWQNRRRVLLDEVREAEVRHEESPAEGTVRAAGDPPIAPRNALRVAALLNPDADGAEGAEAPLTEADPADTSPATAPHPVDRQGMRKHGWHRRAVSGGLVAVVVAALTAWLWPGDASPQEEASLTGRVRCDSGAPVTGVWVEVEGGHSDFAEYHRDGDGASFTFPLSAGQRYSLHVGCGDGDGPRSWRTDNRTPVVSHPNPSAICQDRAALAAGSHYGTCDVAPSK